MTFDRSQYERADTEWGKSMVDPWTLGTGLTSAMLLVCPGVPKSVTLCATNGVAILVLSQTLRNKNEENIRRPRCQC